ncbi:MAG: hypothetical protein V3U24_08480 [Candidatus Neomarinimicrobiota bacterium]
MNDVYDVLRFFHVISFVFMSIPLFNLIVVNERAMMAGGFVYATDRYMENIIRRGAIRCYVFQTSVLVSGILLLIYGPLGFQSLWENWVVLAKTVLLFVLMGLLSYVHFALQPAIEKQIAAIDPDSPPDDIGPRLKPLRARRKRLATFCLFIVITIVILGLQVYSRFSQPLTIALIILAALFSWRANKALVRFGWI